MKHFIQFNSSRCFLRLTWVLALLCCFTASAAVDTSTNATPIAELLKKWDPVPLSEVQKAADDGDVHAMHYLGYCYGEGLRVSRDANQSLAWYKRGMAAGYFMSANNIGMLYKRGQLGSHDMMQAVYYFRYAADRGVDQAQANLGFMYRDGEGVPQDSTQAMYWFQLAAAHGNSGAMVEIGRFYRFGQGVEKKPDEAIRWFEKAANAKDDRMGRVNLGEIYLEQGQTQKAVALFQEAADQGSPNAMAELYRVYWDGNGVPVDHKKAFEWLIKSASNGYVWAQNTLGEGYEIIGWEDDDSRSGIRPKAPNWGQAFRWYRLAAEQGSSEAQDHLGMLYVRGQGVEQDEARGLELVRAAADQGLEAALHDLASLYAQGIGAPRNDADRPINLLRRSKSWEELMRRYEQGLGTERDIFSAAECYCETAMLDSPYYWRPTLNDKIEYNPEKPQKGTRPIPADDGHGSTGILVPYEDSSDDLRHALSLYLKSVLGEGGTAVEIGNRYLKGGQDAPQSQICAWMWFTVAAQNGSSEASAKVKELESRMGPEDLKTAKEKHALQVQEFRRIAQQIPRANR